MTSLTLSLSTGVHFATNTYIVGMQLQKDENGKEYPCRREGLGKDSSAHQLLLDEAALVYYQSTVIGDTDTLSLSSAGLETAKMAKATKPTRSEIQQKPSEKRFGDSFAKKAKRESRILAEAARKDAAVECGSVTLLSLVLSIRVMLEILVETTA
jgi:hypothetical protein